MGRLIFWTLALSFVVVSFLTNPYFTGVAGLLLGGPRDKAWYVSDASLRGMDEHQALADDLFGGALQQVPNYSSMPSNQFNPMPHISTGDGGLVLETLSYRDVNKSAGEAKMSFLYLYLPVDPGDTVVRMQFFRGHTPDGSMMLVGYVDMATGRNTYVYPASGYVRVERVAPDRIRVAFSAFKYECASYVGGDGKPQGWLANRDCPQNLFPRSIQYGPKPADVN